MNIFLLEQDKDGNIDWRKSAKSLDNMRIVKMILESTQMLSTVYQQYHKIPGLYKSTHLNHPCTKWVNKSLENFNSLIKYTHYMGETYSRRFNKKHKSLEVVKLMNEKEYRHFFQSEDFTPPPLAMPSEFKREGVVESYQDYFASKDLIKYDRKDIPGWFLEKREKSFFVRENKKMKYVQMEVMKCQKELN